MQNKETSNIPETFKDYLELPEPETHVCPRCGRCPHCGRQYNDYGWPYYPPYWPKPYQPYWYSGTAVAIGL